MTSFIKLIGLASSVLFLLFISFLVFEQTTVVLRSQANVTSVDKNNSFLFTVPACGKAGSDTQPVRLNFVVLTNSGLGKGNVECKVVAPYDYKLSVRAVQGITDTYGKAFFDIQAENPGIFEVKVMCDDVVLNDRQKLCFE